MALTKLAQEALTFLQTVPGACVQTYTYRNQPRCTFKGPFNQSVPVADTRELNELLEAGVPLKRSASGFYTLRK